MFVGKGGVLEVAPTAEVCQLVTVCLYCRVSFHGSIKVACNYYSMVPGSGFVDPFGDIAEEIVGGDRLGARVCLP